MHQKNHPIEETLNNKKHEITLDPQLEHEDAHEERLHLDETPILIASTASAYKFAGSVLAAIGESYADEFDAVETLEKITKVKTPGCLAGLKDAKTLHDKVINIDEMPEVVLKAVTK